MRKDLGQKLNTSSNAANKSKLDNSSFSQKSKPQQSTKSSSQKSSSSSAPSNSSTKDVKPKPKGPRSASADASNKPKNSNRLKKAEKKPNYNKFEMLSSEEADDEEVMDTSSQDFTKTIWGDSMDKLSTVLKNRNASDGRNRSCSPKEQRQNKFSPIRAPRQ